MEDFRVQIQKLVLNYFKDVDDATVVALVDLFSYRNPTDDKRIHKLMDKFMEDNGLTNAYINYSTDLERKKSNVGFSWYKASASQINMINDVDAALLNLVFNRMSNQFRNAESSNQVREVESTDSPNEVKKINKVKPTESSNKRNFNYIKKTILEMFESLHRSENYMWGEEEDAEIVERIEKMKHV